MMRLVYLLALSMGACAAQAQAQSPSQTPVQTPVQTPMQAEPAPGHPADCLMAQHQLDYSFALPKTAAAIAAGQLSILVAGAGSSTLPGANGARRAYPAQLRQALAEALPGVAVTMTLDVKSRRTAGDMLKTFGTVLPAAKPALVIWQTGTVDAMVGIAAERFSETLDRGIAAIRTVGADVILVNAQYSPRTESMIALGAYTEIMRWIALQHSVPLFNRFAIMRLWADLGTFDFTARTKKLDMAERVHACIGRLLAELVVEGAKLGGARVDAVR